MSAILQYVCLINFPFLPLMKSRNTAASPPREHLDIRPFCYKIVNIEDDTGRHTGQPPLYYAIASR